jgi:2-oxoglutarate ferredoxin oxidoreductase subunit beta
MLTRSHITIIVGRDADRCRVAAAPLRSRAAISSLPVVTAAANARCSALTANDHDGSTKSCAYTREHKVEVVQADFVPPAEEISADYQEGSVKNVMRHDGSWVKFRKLAKDYDPTNCDAADENIREHQRKGEVVTGLTYISPDSKDVHDQNETVAGPLYNLPHAQLCPGNDALQKLMQQFS